MRINQKTLAQKLGVSQMTVSKALRGEPDISEKTIRKVNEAAKSLGYRVNRMARGLADGKSGIIGAMMLRSRGYFYSILWDTIEDEIIAAGFIPLIIRLGYNDIADDMIIERFTQYHPEGLIVCPRSREWMKDFFSNCIKSGQPVIFLGDSCVPKARKVYSTGYDGALKAVKYLISLGHEKIAIVTAAENPESKHNSVREDGYRQALKESGIPFNKNYYVRISRDDEFPERVVEALVMCPEITAVFCVKDVFAVETCLAAKKIGLKVPDQLSVMGFSNDLLFPDHLEVPLTTMAHDPQAIGKALVGNLLKMMKGERVSENTQIEDHLIIRKSTQLLKSKP